jgi:hypothetical protein
LGFKACKDRLALLFVGRLQVMSSASFSVNLHILKGQNRQLLPVIWKMSKMAWVLRVLFKNYLHDCSVHEVKEYKDSCLQRTVDLRKSSW